jgi:hypothetical protein
MQNSANPLYQHLNEELDCELALARPRPELRIHLTKLCLSGGSERLQTSAPGVDVDRRESAGATQGGYLRRLINFERGPNWQDSVR